MSNVLIPLALAVAVIVLARLGISALVCLLRSDAPVTDDFALLNEILHTQVWGQL